jgi:phage-related protein
MFRISPAIGFAIQTLLDQLMADLSAYSAVIKRQTEASRFSANSDLPELGCYKTFVWHQPRAEELH